MENRLKLRFFRIASFFSCRSIKLSNSVQKSIPIPHKLTNYHLMEEPVFRTRKTRPETEAFPRRKVSEKFSPFLAPPASPASPCEFQNCLFLEKTKKNPEKIKRRKNKTKKKKKKTASFRVETEFGGAWWYSSENDAVSEDGTETLFSSRSLTSDSSAPRHRRKARGGGRKVKGSLAVVKNSSDPYNDFRASMVEMIVEKKMFEEREVEHLLQCFLSLNSPHYHRVILQVYAEVREALFFSQLGFRN